MELSIYIALLQDIYSLLANMMLNIIMNVSNAAVS